MGLGFVGIGEYDGVRRKLHLLWDNGDSIFIVFLYHTIPYHFITYHTASYHAVSNRVIPRTMSYHFFFFSNEDDIYPNTLCAPRIIVNFLITLQAVMVVFVKRPAYIKRNQRVENIFSYSRNLVQRYRYTPFSPVVDV